MAYPGKKISELTAATTIANTDLIVVVDMTAGETKKITLLNAKTTLQGITGVTGVTGVKGVSGVTGVKGIT